MLTGSITHPDASRRGLTSLMMAKASTDWEDNERFDELPADIRELLAGLLSREPAKRLTDTASIVETLHSHATSDAAAMIRLAGIVPSNAAAHAADLQRLSDARNTAVANRKPPTNRSWIAIAASFFGGAITLAAAGWLIEITTDRGTVTVQTDQKDAIVRLVERPDPDQSDNTMTAMPSIYLDAIDPEKLNAVYKDKMVREHLDRLTTELATERLADSIEAVARIAEPDDVELVRATFLPARRYGGWVSGSETPSGQFMQATADAYKNMPKPAVVKAIIHEFEEGNERSIATIGMLFPIYPNGWLAEVNENDRNRLIDAVNEYQSGNPAVTPDYRDEPGAIHQTSVAHFRERLLIWASEDFLATEQIKDIRKWLPHQWQTADTFDWMNDSELLKQLDGVVGSCRDQNEMASLPQNQSWANVLRNPWPSYLRPYYVSAANELDLNVPVPIRLSIILGLNQRLSAEQIRELAKVVEMNDAERTTMANMLVLHGLPIVPSWDPAKDEISGSAFSVNSFGSLYPGQANYSAMQLARILFESSVLWINRIDQLRSETTMPDTFDILMRSLASYLDKANEHPSLIQGISLDHEWVEQQISESENQVFSWNTSSNQPSPRDKIKAKKIAERLHDYLSQ